uniref:CO dehydrogenase flavoprotein C-terminal domain-containing protein n=1 Tax=Timema genevievae TaxID=629358 RepID=A0A7R9K2B6_TIMGE|nr:unnamed protein product [Timema genevievae]
MGVYRRKVEPKIYIDITGIKELRTISTEPTLVLGGSVSLTEAMELFYDLSKETQYAYTKVLADHIDLIANVPVRNIMPRAQNAHAYVNAGFMMKLSDDGTGKVVQKPNIVFGGIDPQFLHAIDTENFLIGKSVLDEQVLQGALSTLDAELLPDYISPDAVPEYRKGLAKALFYKENWRTLLKAQNSATLSGLVQKLKGVIINLTRLDFCIGFILSLAKAKVKKSLISGGDLLIRPLSSAKQTYDTDKSVWPLNQPVPKLEALAQCSGEAAYINDHPAIPGELFGAFVVTTIGQGNISNMDSKEALGLGMVAQLTF